MKTIYRQLILLAFLAAVILSPQVSPAQNLDSGRTASANDSIVKPDSLRTRQQEEKIYFKGYIDNLSAKTTFLGILIIVVSLSLILVNILYAYSFYKWFLPAVKQKNRDDPAEETSAPAVPEKVNVPIRKPITEPVADAQMAEDKKDEVARYAPVPVEAPILKSQAGKFFLSELLVTAGPRKKMMSDTHPDIDLGEDVCGFVNTHDTIILWLLDGTSDQFCLKDPASGKEYFSSRLLAQTVANKVRGLFLKGQRDLKLIATQALSDLRQEWVRTIRKLPISEQEILRENIEDKNIPHCSTTLLLSILRINGDLHTYRSGDSTMCIFVDDDINRIKYRETSLASKNDESNDRIFFQLVLDDDKQLQINSNEPKYETLDFQNVNTLIAFSDGIGPETDRFLKDEYQKDPEASREQIIFQVQGTADDKTICFVEIRELEIPVDEPVLTSANN